ncbi:MAG: arginine--tRNA ligase [Phycisphaerales bacterium]|nr:arginine--tRNA ligase [Planctomycetota bacterium]
MSESSDPIALLDSAFRAATAAAFPEIGDADPLITASKQAALGDFQANIAMSLSKRVGKPPRDVAAAIVAKAGAMPDLQRIAEPLTDKSIAGHGFINIRLKGDALASLLASMDTPALGVPAPEVTETIAVDLCGVNLAKQMHVGHLRATIIGDALARVFERLGHKVVRQNHLGDWGLPIAMVTAKIAADAKAGKIDLATLRLDDLDRAYKQAQRECTGDEAGLAAVERFDLGPKARAELEEQVSGAREKLAAAKSTLVKLQAHDPEIYAVWQRIARITVDECVAVCARLHATVRAEDTAGESSYSNELGEIVDDLVNRNIAEESDGALVVRLDGPGDLDDRGQRISEPCIIRKSDGGFLYATTDLAGIRRRVRKFGASRLVYAVDARQSLHFQQVFAAARKAGYADMTGGKVATLRHAGFGMVLGEDGRPFKTRSGENVKLTDLIDEAHQRASAEVNRRSAALPDAERDRIAEAVGVAAIKYADLCNDRMKDYVFSFDRMVAFEGNTGPYLLYAFARIKSILRKAQAEKRIDTGPNAPFRKAPLAIVQPQEKTLALAILRYPGALKSMAEACEPHRLCGFLYDLAGAFSSFYDACPVLSADNEQTMLSRLRLCDLTGRVLYDGLTTLGLPTVERM